MKKGCQQLTGILYIYEFLRGTRIFIYSIVAQLFEIISKVYVKIKLQEIKFMARQIDKVNFRAVVH